MILLRFFMSDTYNLTASNPVHSLDPTLGFPWSWVDMVSDNHEHHGTTALRPGTNICKSCT